MIQGNAPEEEILSVLDVPPGKMGRVIGKRGASILSIKESCKYFSPLSLFRSQKLQNIFLVLDFRRIIFCSAEILIGGSKGPPDKVSLSFPYSEHHWECHFLLTHC